MGTQKVQVSGYTRHVNGKTVHVGSYVQNRRRADMLTVAIDHFGRRKDVAMLSDPAQAWSNCDEASVAFAAYLDSLGIDNDIVSLEEPNRTHVCVLVDGEVIDWTARQYYPAADVPDIYHEPGDRGFWQGVIWPQEWRDKLVKMWSPHRRIKWEDKTDEYEQVRIEEPDFFDYTAGFYEGDDGGW